MANYRPIECPRCLMHVGDKGCALHRAAPRMYKELCDFNDESLSELTSKKLADYRARIRAILRDVEGKY